MIVVVAQLLLLLRTDDELTQDGLKSGDGRLILASQVLSTG